jgi:hypothetical protein
MKYSHRENLNNVVSSCSPVFLMEPEQRAVDSQDETCTISQSQPPIHVPQM